ncbi:MAG TPA: DNA recombination protein RmuC [Terriglobales bacterium]|nr:DNA recombination protein RmuC [Terriglobales bacterium]
MTLGPVWVIALLGFLAGAVLGWLARAATTKPPAAGGASDAVALELRAQIAAARAETEQARRAQVESERGRAAAEARAAEIERSVAEQRAQLEAARERLAETFKSLASEALSRNNADFLTLAEQKFGALKQSAVTDLQARQLAIEQLVKPIAESLTSYQKEARELEQQRVRELSAVGEQLRSVAQAQNTLQQETSRLVNALRSPQVRGRWGEVQLRRAAELAGMAAHCDFIEQVTVTSEDGRLRPDMIVKLPAGREVVVDSKVPLSGFLEALEAATDAEREAAITKHAKQLRTHVDKLASKQYWEQFEKAPDLAVLFIPNDSFYAAAVQRDPDVIEYALANRVIIATPSTFVGFLRSVEYGWRQEQIAESAQKVSELGRKLYERIVIFLKHLDKVGDSLHQTVKHYNASVASLQTRLVPLAERFDELGAATQEPLPEIEQITEEPRTVKQKALPGMEETRGAGAGE